MAISALIGEAHGAFGFEPMRLGLARGLGVGDLDRVEAAASGQGILIGDQMAAGAQLALIAEAAQAGGDGEAAPVGGFRKRNGDQRAARSNQGASDAGSVSLVMSTPI